MYHCIISVECEVSVEDCVRSFRQWKGYLNGLYDGFHCSVLRWLANPKTATNLSIFSFALIRHEVVWPDWQECMSKVFPWCYSQRGIIGIS